MGKFSVLFVAIIAISMGCGASPRRTFQGDTGFDRCFERDYDANISAEDKNACWRAWLDRSNAGQPADKVAYGKLRMEEIAQGIAIPGPPGPPGAFDQRPDPELPASPAPGNGVTTLAPNPAPGKAPTLECETRCKSAFEPCPATCTGKETPAEQDLCNQQCSGDYSACMKRCFE